MKANQSKPKTILIPWSGGLDSTYLVWKSLKAGHHVYWMYINLRNNEKKVECEKKAIEAIRSELLKVEPHNQLYPAFQPTLEVGGALSFDLKQNALWLTAAAYECHTGIDEVQIGYVCGDCSISFMREMQTFWKALNGFTKSKLPKLTFPLIKKLKHDMVEELPEEIRRHVWFCEMPTPEQTPCGICVPCKRQEDLLLKLYPIPKPELRKEFVHLNRYIPI